MYANPEHTHTVCSGGVEELEAVEWGRRREKDRDRGEGNEETEHRHGQNMPIRSCLVGERNVNDIDI